MALFLGLQKCYAPVWNRWTKSKNLPFKLSVLRCQENSSKCEKLKKNARKWPFLRFVIFTILAAKGAIFGVQRCLNAQDTQKEYILALRT